MFVSKKTPNNAVTPQSSIVLIGLVALFAVFLETNIKISRDLGACPSSVDCESVMLSRGDSLLSHFWAQDFITDPWKVTRQIQQGSLSLTKIGMLVCLQNTPCNDVTSPSSIVCNLFECKIKISWGLGAQYIAELHWVHHCMQTAGHGLLLKLLQFD